MPSDWTKLRAWFDPIARRFNYYTAYELPADEHVRTVDFSGGVDGFREHLRGMGYEPQYLSAAKRHPETGELHDLSYRSVPQSHPEAAQGKEIYDHFNPGQCQYHVHAWEIEGSVWIGSHYETRPDFFGPSVSLRRQLTHYRPGPETYLIGVTDLNL